MKSFNQILKETGGSKHISRKEKIKESSVNLISKDQLYSAFDVDGDGVVSESDYAAHIMWHMNHPQLFEKAIGNLDGIHLEHIVENDVECASSETENFGKEADFMNLAETTHNEVLIPPALLVLRRINIRQLTNSQKVALYYSKTINRYLTVPYNDKGILDLNMSK